jgi:hypothetical protein
VFKPPSFALDESEKPVLPREIPKNPENSAILKIKLIDFYMMIKKSETEESIADSIFSAVDFV